MKINIGDNIKKLRKQHNITQEKLAEYLDVTYQTVSKWENGTSLPSIVLLPSIANFFNISIDELYDLEKFTDEENILEYENKYIELCTKGDNVGRVNLMRVALEEYPRNYKFMNYLARSLYRCENIDQYSDEIILLCERILDDCNVESIRFSALQTISRAYNSIGQIEKAVKYANEMPSMASAKEFFLREILSGEERIEQLQRNIFFLTFNAGKATIYLATDSFGMGAELSPEEKISLYEAANTIYKAIANDGNYLHLNGKFSWHYNWIAQNYCLINDSLSAFENLYRAEKAAIAMDEFMECNEEKAFTSLMINRITANPQNILKHWDNTHCGKLYEMIQHSDYDLIRNTEEFKNLEERLKGRRKNA